MAYSCRVEKRLRRVRQAILATLGAVGLTLILLDAPNVVSGWLSVGGLILILACLLAGS